MSIIIYIKTFIEGDFAICEVFNDGPPIPDEVASRLFEPFFTTQLGRSGVPVYVLYAADKPPLVLSEVLTPAQVRDALSTLATPPRTVQP